jgi:hypothetical protein
MDIVACAIVDVSAQAALWDVSSPKDQTVMLNANLRVLSPRVLALLIQ